VRFFGPRVRQWLAELDEPVAGKGDGVVTVARGRLGGVGDTVVLKFRHDDPLSGVARADAEKLQREIVKRLLAPVTAK
jgi:hypothetical protein